MSKPSFTSLFTIISNAKEAFEEFEFELIRLRNVENNLSDAYKKINNLTEEIRIQKDKNEVLLRKYKNLQKKFGTSVLDHFE